MKAYELLFFVDPASTEEARAGAMKRIEVAITEGGGVIEEESSADGRVLFSGLRVIDQ